MASIGSLTGSTSSTSSIYGNRNSNILSGLASGLDTESMIEGMIQGYQQKITSLEQDRTIVQWKQEAYQSISNKLVEFARKYTSYSSDTNLFSSSFFNNAILTSAVGTYADKVTATGKSSSAIVLNSIKQLATAARYTTSGGIASNVSGGVAAGGAIGDLTNPHTVSTMSGSLSFTYGSQEITIDFDEQETFARADGSLDTDAFQKAIEEKLAEQDIVIGDNTYKADERIGVTVSQDGTVTLKDKSGANNSVYISGATGDLAGKVSYSGERPASFQVTTTDAVEEIPMGEYLSGKTIEVTLNGQTKKITLGEISISDQANQDQAAEAVRSALETAINDAFGQNKVSVSLDGGRFSFDAGSGNTFHIQSEMGEVLGLGNGGVANYVNTSQTLEDLLGTDADGNLKGLKANGSGTYDLVINGVTVGSYAKDTALETVISAINSNSEAGVNVSYSKLTNEFVFTAKETGSGGKIAFGETDSTGAATDLAAAIFGAADQGQVEVGKDAIFTASINGGQETTFTRSTNTFDMDGMSLTLKGTFSVDEAAGETGVTFASETDADAVVDVIKQMVTDYNAILSEVKKAYTNMPLEQSDGSEYLPLTDEDRADMSDSAIEAYEEKAKTGLLFMDSDLSSLYNALRSAITPSGTDGSLLRSIGIETSYSDGLTTISLDEEALRQALSTNPDRVKEAFTKSQEMGASTDGLMASIQKVTDRYAATTGATKGILIEKAGSQYSPTSALSNDMLTQMEEIDNQIERWQDKMSDRVDYYTNKFTQLEMLIAQMNSQSSTLAGLMGGY